EKKDKELVRETISALKRITGSDWGIYPARWLQWWDENKNKAPDEIIKPKTITPTDITDATIYRDMTGIEGLPPDKVIVVRNDRCDKNPFFDKNYDAIQDILTNFKVPVPHKVVGKSELESDTFNWKDTWALVFNCNFYREHCCCPTCKPGGADTGERTVSCIGCDKHEIHKTELSDKTIKKIREFVETGGYLFTEDLNIKEIIQRAFNKTIQGSTSLPKQTVPIMPTPTAVLHPYLKWVFEAPPSKSSDTPAQPEKSGETISVKPGEFRIDAEWQIDDESPNIKIIDEKAVTVLIMSPKLVTKSEPIGAVAVTFGVGGDKYVPSDTKEKGYAPGGRVLHVMSHFGKQKSKVDEFALQNLLLNFLIELNQRRPKGKK
ncbi:MAG: hypothetical protein QME51_08270, partial [Planctomycetota bacterium]|nr:hypothetical protein [Planctomycetota bacterium]MDI6788352.1 hypothetical protein [Planctomycetota bacterium]